MNIDQGYLVSSPVASVVAAAAGTIVHAMPANRTAKIRKIHIYNHNAVTSNVAFGAGLGGAFVASGIAYQVLNGMDLIITQDQIPDVEFIADITASASAAAAAPNNVQIQIEVEEFIGTTG